MVPLGGTNVFEDYLTISGNDKRSRDASSLKNPGFFPEKGVDREREPPFLHEFPHLCFVLIRYAHELNSLALYPVV